MTVLAWEGEHPAAGFLQCCPPLWIGLGTGHQGGDLPGSLNQLAI